jgi:hypothetical protein
MQLQDEATWLRCRIIRMRAALRFAINSEVEGIIREFIADAEDRLLAIEHPLCSDARQSGGQGAHTFAGRTDESPPAAPSGRLS